jgi:hypothetical protein
MPRLLLALLALPLLAVGKPDPADVKTKLVWRYTFAADEKRPGKAVKAKVEKGTLILEGEGHLDLGKPAYDPTNKPLSVGAKVWLDGATGVVVAHGGEDEGFSLYIDRTEPVFAVRSSGKLTVARSGKKLARGRWYHVMGVLDADGKLRVWIDGKFTGSAVQGALLSAKPKDGLSIGADLDSWVGEYRSNNPLTGRLRDVRLYWSAPAEKDLNAWAGLAE